MTATTSSEAPRTDTGECAPLLASAHLGIYRENTFRITGLPVDATEREIKKQAGRLKMMEELGQGADGGTHAYALQPPATADQIRAAMQRLKEPELRLIDEFFWFWPRDFGKSGEDPAIQAIQRGDANSAYQQWLEDALDPHEGHMAVHNLAILFHLVAIDWTLIDLQRVVDSEREAKIEKYWRSSFHYWEKVATNDALWEALKLRTHALDDRRLTSGLVRRMRASLPEAIDKINAEAAIRFAESGRMDWARKHVAFMNETHQGLDDVEKTATLVLTPARKRVQQLIKNARDQTANDPSAGAVSAEQLTTGCHPLLTLFELFHGKDDHQRAELFDEVAGAANHCCVKYVNATHDFAPANDALQRALVFATSRELQDLIKQNIAIFFKNVRDAPLQPIYEEINAINEGTQTAAAKLAAVIGRIIPSVVDLERTLVGDDASIPELKDSCALFLRSISITAHNKEDDYATALQAIRLALTLVCNEDHKIKLAQDLQAIERTVAANTCHYCKKNLAAPGKAKRVSMYGDVQRGFGSVRYRTTSVSVPSCNDCARKESIGDNVWLTIMCGMPVLAALWALVATSSGHSKGPEWGAVFGVGCVGFFVGAILGRIAGWLAKRSSGLATDSSYEGIREMQRKGWSIGDKPGRYG